MSFAVNANTAATYTPAVTANPAPARTATVTTTTDGSGAGIAGDANHVEAGQKTPFAAHGMRLDMSQLAGGGPDPAQVKARLESLAASGEKVGIGYDGAASVARDSDGNFTITTYDVINGFAGESYEESGSVTVSAQALEAGTLPPKVKTVLDDLMPRDPNPAPTGNGEAQEAFTWAPQDQ